MSKPGTLTLTLVRSGATEWDDAGRLQGSTDLPMSESGREALAACLEHSLNGQAKALTLVLHACDEASVQTAQAIVDRGGARRREAPGLCDMDIGLWAGLREAELFERHPTLFRTWREDPGSITPPDGENLIDAEERILGALSRSLSKVSRGPVAVVLRPFARAVVRCRLQDRPLAELWKAADEAQPIETFEVPRSRLEPVRTGLRAGA
ncbi:MAG: histidine phosphatase family protein [Phycisphaerales bacterium]|nr:histidine phosphatase family protein [Phycisphaerales bacterium]